MRLCTVSWLLLFSLNVAFGQQNQDKLDWQPWSDSAFAQAKKEGRFVLLNLGAVWCHLCHVMDEITYQDPDSFRWFVCWRPFARTQLRLECELVPGLGIVCSL